MIKTMDLIKEDFVSSCYKTEQYKNFHKVFKREFSKMMKPITKKIKISKINHFDINGFFKTNNNKTYYFSISDLRYNKDKMLFRTATDFKDFMGGQNCFFPVSDLNNFAELILNMDVV